MRSLRQFTMYLYVFLAGALFAIAGIWPVSSFNETYNYFFKHDRWVQLSPKEILYSDLGLYPYRQLAMVPYKPNANAGLREIELPAKQDRRANPLVFVDTAARPKVLTLIAGLTDTKDSLLGALLLDPTGKIIHHWPIRLNHPSPGITQPDVAYPPDTDAMVHGLEVYPDGSIIAALHKSPVLTRYDACGNIIWRRKMNAHHSVVADGNDHVWTWEGYDMVRLRVSDGTVVHRISLMKLADTAPGKYILSARRMFHTDIGTKFGEDPFHPNDIDPLPESMAKAFPMFKPGHLLVSLRTGNLLMVVDPRKDQIVWWMQDGAFAQHDPDWHPDGSILAFDNNTDFGPSRIIRIDPKTKSYTTAFDGAKYGIYTDLMGNYEMRSDGAVIVNASRQGRVLEVDANGKRLFEFINRYDAKTGRAGVVTEARLLPVDYFKSLPRCAK